MKSPGIIIAPVIAFLILIISCPQGFAEAGTKTEAGAKTDTGTKIDTESKTGTVSITETESKAGAESGFRDEPGTSPDRGRHSDVQFVSAMHRMEYWNENTLLLRMWPGTYTITAHYANGDSRSEEVGVTFDRLRYLPMFQNPLQYDLQRARWIPGGGQNLKKS